MEIYRQTYGPHENCRSYKYLTKISAIGQPQADGRTLRIKDLQRREELLFYPKDDIIKLFGPDVIQDIIQCRCDVCFGHLKISGTDQTELLGSITSRKRPKVVLLAILVYFGKSFVIKYISRLDTIYDAALAISARTLQDKVWAEIFECKLEDGKLSTETEEMRAAFLDNYAFVANLFNPPVFSTAESWMSEYTEDRRLPFLDDAEHSTGSFGEVRKFNIHPSYLDVEEHFRQRDWCIRKKKSTYSFSLASIC